MGRGRSKAGTQKNATATVTQTAKQSYMDRINAATTLDELDEIGEEAAYDDNLTNKEISDIILYGQRVAQSWQPTAKSTAQNFSNAVPTNAIPNYKRMDDAQRKTALRQYVTAGMYNNGEISQSTFGQIAIDNFSNAILDTAVDRGWITKKQRQHIKDAHFSTWGT